MTIEGRAARDGVLAGMLAILGVGLLIGAEHVAHPAAAWLGPVLALLSIAASGLVLASAVRAGRASQR